MKLFFLRILAKFPTALPVGAKEFETWAESVIKLAGKYADADSMRWALASMVIHADAKLGHLPKMYFVTRLRKAAANQVASQVFTDIKLKQEAAAKAASVTTTQTVEATTAVTQEPASDVVPTQNAN